MSTETLNSANSSDNETSHFGGVNWIVETEPPLDMRPNWDEWNEDDEFSYSSDESSDENSDESRDELDWDKLETEITNPTLPEFHVGMRFVGASEFRAAVRKYAVDNVKEIKLVKNERHKVRGQCRFPNCPWIVYASVDNKTQEFVVKTFNPEHTCTPSFKCNMITSTLLARKYEERIRSHPGWKSKHMQTVIRQEMGVNVSVSQCRRTKLKAMKKYLGSYTEEYAKIWDYAQALLDSDKNNTIKVNCRRNEIIEASRFQRMYICFGACKKGFLSGCRKIIGLDGCFSKGPIKFEILSAIGRDANNQMYPIAWAIVEVENKENWDWFLRLLAEDLDMRSGNEWVLISDQQKGLQVAIQNSLPDAEHRMCARHIYANWSKKHKGGNLKKLFWKCAWSYSLPQYLENLEFLREESVEATNDLTRTDPKHWCRAFFKDCCKCDNVDNNMSETFNNWILDCRHKPIITMLEEMRRMVMVRIANEAMETDKYPSNICPKICEKLNKSINQNRDCHLIWNGRDGYEVTEKMKNVKGETKEHTHVVNLDNHNCSCKVWNLSGIPCSHAVCAILNKGDEPINYVADCFHKEMHRKTYSHVMAPVVGMQNWPKTNLDPPKPPFKRNMPGRPKKHARREGGVVPKPSNNTKMAKTGVIIRCSICHKSGHNRATCPKAPPRSGQSSSGQSSNQPQI